MLKQILLIASASAATLVVVPDSADARHRYYGGYTQPYYGSNYGYYPQRYSYGYRQPYYGRHRYYGRRARCGSGTTGLIVGGAAGALLGREIERGGGRSRYYYGRRNGGTTGAIIGGAVGALVGREIARRC